MKNQKLLKIFRRSGLLLIFAILAMPAVSWAALPAFMTLTGETQGVIQGSVTQTGREDSIEVIGFGHNVSAVFDASSGLPSGKRQHRPVRIVKNIDLSSPKLFTALTTNENLTDVTIRFWQPVSSGEEEQFYTVQLVNAKIVSIMPSHCSADADCIPTRPSEAVTFTYQTIVITWEEGGVTSESNWNQ